MNHMNLIPALAALGAILMMPAAADAQSGSQDWEAEVGTGLGYHDNFFMTGDKSTQKQQSALVASVYATGERVLKHGDRRWDLSGGAEAYFNNDISGANSQSFWGGAETRFDRARAGVGLTYEPNKIYSEEGNGVFQDEASLSLFGRYEISPTMSASLEYRRKRQDFDTVERGRDADIDELTGMFRLVLTDETAMRAFAIWSEKDARDDSSSWSAIGVGLALEWSPADQWRVFSRVRVRDREYEDAPLGTSNYDRDDTIIDGLINARVIMGTNWGLDGQLEYRDADSSRDDRNYDAMAIYLNAFKTF